MALCLQAGTGISHHVYENAVAEKQTAVLLMQCLLGLLLGTKAEVDLLLMPTLPILPPTIADKKVDVRGKSIPAAHALFRFTYPANVSGLPALSFPVITGSFPVGLQVLAPPGEEGRLIRFAGLLEKLGYGYKVPPGTREKS